MTPKRLKEIEDLLGNDMRKWEIGSGEWINIAEEFVAEIARLQEQVKSAREFIVARCY